MKCIRVHAIGRFEIEDLPCPVPGPDDVLIKVEVTGLCRTDLKIVRSGHRDLVLPRIPGEEVVGMIQTCGARVTRFHEGERVYVYPGVWCGTCPACQRGAENLCRQMQIMGFHRDGGFAEQVVAPEQSLIRAPESVPAEAAVFAEPLSCCLNALELAGIGTGQSLAVWGAGPAGTLLARAAQARGIEVSSIDPDARRRDRIGGESRPPDRLFDAAIVAVGSNTAYVEALEHLAPRGRLVVFSGLSPLAAMCPVDFNSLHYHEQSLVGAYGCCWRHGQDALACIANGSVPVLDMITHRLPIWELDEALGIVERRDGLKVLLYP